MFRELMKEILKEELLGKKESTVTSKNPAIGKVCMFRTYSAGVHFGELVSIEGKECWVKNSRRVFYWTKACSLSQLAIEGSKEIEKCQIAMTVPEQFLTEVIEVIPMSETAKEQLQGSTEWKK